MKKVLFAVLVLILIYSCAFGIGAVSFMREGVGAQEAAMGGANTAGAEGVNSVYWNPAGLTRMDAYMWELSSMYDFQTLDRRYAYLGIAKRTEDSGNFGFQLINYGVSNIEILDETGTFQSKQENQEYAAGLTYANKINYQIRYGFSVKGHYQDLVGYKAMGYSVDLGVIFQPLLDQEIYFGAMLQNLAGEMFWTGYKEDMMSSYKVGASAKLFDDIVKVNLDVVKEESNPDLIFKAGLEFKIADYFFVRAGIDEKYPAAGLGVKYEGYKIDYAYMYNKYDLGDTHQISMIFMW